MLHYLNDLGWCDIRLNLPYLQEVECKSFLPIVEHFDEKFFLFLLETIPYNKGFDAFFRETRTSWNVGKLRGNPV